MNLRMDTAAKQFLMMLTCFLQRKAWTPPEGLNLPEWYDLSKIHSLEPILYHMLRPFRNSFSQSFPQSMAKLEKSYRGAVYYALTQESHMEDILPAFQGKGVDLVIFKGYRLKDCYPVPELRTMGDLDLLIREEDRDRSHQILGKLGYECTIGRGDVWVYRKGGISLEVHTDIARNLPNHPFDYQSYFSDAIRHTEPYRGYTCLETNYHLIFLIYHIAKHLACTGAGIRLFLDIALFLREFGDRLDWDFLWNSWRQIGLDRVASTVFFLCGRWFDTQIPVECPLSKEALEALESYIISGGVFGFETHNAGDLSLRQGVVENKYSPRLILHLALLKNYIFPSIEYLKKSYPPLEKHRCLLPVAWVKRWWQGMFHRRKASLSMVKTITAGDTRRAEMEQRLLGELGLYKE